MTEANNALDLDLNTTDAAATAETTKAPKVKKEKKSVSKADLTQEFLKERLELRGEDFFWKVDGVVTKVGDFAGGRREIDGYYSIVLAGTNYSGKQLAYFYENGTWPVRLPKEAKAKIAKEAKPHVPRLAPVVTEESKKAARAAAKLKADAKKAAAAAAPSQEIGGESVADIQGNSDVSADPESQTL
jgi:hypothetical protein